MLRGLVYDRFVYDRSWLFSTVALCKEIKSLGSDAVTESIIFSAKVVNPPSVVP